MADKPCNCESLDCRHPRMGVLAGERRAMYVGPICDECADTHMKEYLVMQCVCGWPSHGGATARELEEHIVYCSIFDPDGEHREA